MLKIHETTRDDGSFEPVYLKRGDEGLFVVRAAEALALPAGALEMVMARFGATLEDGVKLTEVDALDLPVTVPSEERRRLRHVRHLARFDVIARDYLVLEAPPAEPLCVLATTVAGALEHLARAAR